MGPVSSTPDPSYDMWSLGCVLSEMATLKLLKKDRLRHSNPPNLDGVIFPELLAEMKVVHSGLLDPLCTCLLEHDPVQRLTPGDVIETVKTYLKTSKMAWPRKICRLQPKPSEPSLTVKRTSKTRLSLQGISDLLECRSGAVVRPSAAVPTSRA